MESQMINHEFERPIISVIITAYNRKEYLNQAIDSAMNQTIPRMFFEVIVVKNFVETSTEEKYKHSNVKFINSDEEKIGAMMLNGIEQARGTILCFLDDDDLFFPDKLLNVLKAFQNGACYFRNSFRISEDDPESIKRIMLSPSSKRDLADFSVESRNIRSIATSVRMGAALNMSTISISRNILWEHRDALDRLAVGPDLFAFYVALESKGKLIISKKSLSIYRVHHSASRFTYDDFDTYRRILIEHTFSNLATLNLIRNEVLKSSSSIKYLKASISAWEIQYALLNSEAPNIMVLLRSIRFSLSRRKILILLGSILSIICYTPFKGISSKIFIFIYRTRVNTNTLVL